MSISSTILFRLGLLLLVSIGLPVVAQESSGRATPEAVVARQTIVGTTTKATYDLNGNLIVGAPSGRLEMRLQDRMMSERLTGQRVVSQELLRDRREAKIAEIRLDEGEGTTVVTDAAITGVTPELRQAIRKKVTTRLVLEFDE